jgi:hypothetical protein
MLRLWAAAAVLAASCGSAVAAPERPDLVVTSVVFSQDGAALVVSVGVRNRGAANAARSQTEYDLGGVRLGARRVPPLQRGAAWRSTVRLVVPRSVPAGRRMLRVCADAAHGIAEANERNNCRAAVGLVGVADRTPPFFAGLQTAVTCIPGPAGGPTRSSSYRLTWVGASDDFTPAPELAYDVYQASSPGGEDFSTPTYTIAAGATSFSTPPLPDDRAYYFVVRARDAAGNRDGNTVERPGRNLCV